MPAEDQRCGRSVRERQLHQLAELDALLRASTRRPGAHDEALLCLLECTCQAAQALGRAGQDEQDRERLHEALRAARAAATCLSYAMTCPERGPLP